MIYFRLRGLLVIESPFCRAKRETRLPIAETPFRNLEDFEVSSLGPRFEFHESTDDSTLVKLAQRAPPTPENRYSRNLRCTRNRDSSPRAGGSLNSRHAERVLLTAVLVIVIDARRL